MTNKPVPENPYRRVDGYSDGSIQYHTWQQGFDAAQKHYEGEIERYQRKDVELDNINVGWERRLKVETEKAYQRGKDEFQVNNKTIAYGDMRVREVAQEVSRALAISPKAIPSILAKYLPPPIKAKP